MRNCIWDFLHGYSISTRSDDVDVVYFDQNDKLKRHDEDIEMQLRSVVPNINWSVKNQARMHVANKERPYASLAAAISRWPETATALIVRLRDNDSLEFIAPFGFDDLLTLTLRATPAFKDRKSVIEARMNGKNWVEIWPRLRVHLD